MRISDWSSDVCSSDLILGDERVGDVNRIGHQKYPSCFFFSMLASPPSLSMMRPCRSLVVVSSISWITSDNVLASLSTAPVRGRSEEHTSELQSLMRISYAVFCLKKKKNTQNTN